MDWFLYDNGLRHERVNIEALSIFNCNKQSFLGSKALAKITLILRRDFILQILLSSHLIKHPTIIYLFKVSTETIGKGVKYVQS